jgi:DNA-binding MarR family transcriptional regulator
MYRKPMLTTLKELHPLDEPLLLMNYALRGLVVEADKFLASHGLSRVHHRILYVLARTDDMSVGDLLNMLGISKQALHQPMKFLQENGYIVAVRSKSEHRVKLLSLTPKGRRMELSATDFERSAMQAAFALVSKEGRNAWLKIMVSLANRIE